MRKNIFVILLSLAFLACGSNKYQKEIQEIDSLLVITDSLNQELLSINIDSLQEIRDIASVGLEKLIAYQPTKESISIRLKYVDHYGGIKKAINKFLPQYSSLQKGLHVSDAQLRSLRHDMEEQLMDDSLAVSYLKEEYKILKNLTFMTNKYLMVIESKKELYYLVHDRVEHFVDSVSKVEEVKQFGPE